MSPSPLVIAAARVGSGVVYGIGNLILPIRLFLWDFALTIYNLLVPLLPAERVVPEGRPGANGLWPEYIPPTETDSRSCCPMLNAMANHGESYSSPVCAVACGVVPGHDHWTGLRE